MEFIQKIYEFIKAIVSALEFNSADEFAALDFIFGKIAEFFAK